MSRSRRQPQNLQAIDICDVSAAYVCVCVCRCVCEINELTEWLASQSVINSEHRCNLHKSFSLLPSSTSASDATFMKSSERLRVDQGQ